MNAHAVMTYQATALKKALFQGLFSFDYSADGISGRT